MLPYRQEYPSHRMTIMVEEATGVQLRSFILQVLYIAYTYSVWSTAHAAITAGPGDVPCAIAWPTPFPEQQSSPLHPVCMMIIYLL